MPFLRGKAIAEQYLTASGLNYTILMPNLFMEVWCPNIVGRAVLAGRPVTLLGEGKRQHSMISAADVAAFAAAAAGNERAYKRGISVRTVASGRQANRTGAVGCVPSPADTCSHASEPAHRCRPFARAGVVGMTEIVTAEGKLSASKRWLELSARQEIRRKQRERGFGD